MHVVRIASLVLWVRTPLDFNGLWSYESARQYFETSFILNLRLVDRLMLVGSILQNWKVREECALVCFYDLTITIRRW